MPDPRFFPLFVRGVHRYISNDLPNMGCTIPKYDISGGGCVIASSATYLGSLYLPLELSSISLETPPDLYLLVSGSNLAPAYEVQQPGTQSTDSNPHQLANPPSLTLSLTSALSVTGVLNASKPVSPFPKHSTVQPGPEETNMDVGVESCAETSSVSCFES